MPFFQRPVPPLAPNLRLAGKTAIVTGANKGLGYETARQFLAFGASKVILAVRNTALGDVARTRLLADADVKKAGAGEIRVMQLDLANLSTVLEFAKKVKIEELDLHILLLNAGIGPLIFEKTGDGFENAFQVNYLSNVLLTFELLPLLQSTAERTGSPSRISLLGSRMHWRTSFSEHPIPSNASVFHRFNDPQQFDRWTLYSDTKVLVAMFVEAMGQWLDPDKVIINNVCPGMVDTGMTDVLPFYIRIPVELVKKVRARKVEMGGSIVVNAAVVVGKESHGAILGDMEVLRSVVLLLTHV